MVSKFELKNKSLPGGDSSLEKPLKPILAGFMTISTRLDRLSPGKWVWLVLLIAVIQRFALWFMYQPVLYSDTPSYRRLAATILHGFDHYDATRTPGYPLILAIFGSDRAVWLTQMVMGVVVTMLFFYLGWQFSRHAWFGGLVALAHTFNPGQIFFEPNLLSETATTFWIVLTVAGMVYWFYHPENRTIWQAFGMGLCASLAWLTRPLFIYLPVWVLLFILIDWQKGRIKLIPHSLGIGLVYLLPVFLFLGVWVGFVRVRFHIWGLTTMTGYHMVQHTGVFFEYVPDQYAQLRDTYLKYRAAHIAQYGTQTNTIWDAIPEMEKISGKSFVDLSRLLTKISLQLIREHPNLYLRNVWQGWWYFWRGPVYWSPEAFHLKNLLPVLSGVILVERLSVFACNLIFIISSLLVVLWRKIGQSLGLNPAWYFLLGSVWIASVFQTFLDHGDNPRFLIPLQSIVILWVLWVAVVGGVKYLSVAQQQATGIQVE